MDKLIIILIMILFSREDLQKMSIPTVWFWGLFGVVLLRMIFPTPWFFEFSLMSFSHSFQLLISNLTGYLLIDEFIGAGSANYIQWSSFCSSILPQAKLTLPIIISCARGFFGFVLIALPYYISKKKGMGSGDVIYFSCLSLLFPISRIWVAFFVTFSMGCLVGLLVLILKKRDLLLKIPLIPFISFGFLVCIFL